MCQFISFLYHIPSKEIYFGTDLKSHSGIEAGWGLWPNSYAECEWMEKFGVEVLEIRHENHAMASAIEADLLTRFKSQAGVIKAARVGKNSWMEVHYKNALWHGKVIKYRLPSYTPYYVAYYRHGKLNGLAKALDVDGKTVETCHYKDGVQVGPTRVYQSGRVVKTYQTAPKF